MRQSGQFNKSCWDGGGFISVEPSSESELEKASEVMRISQLNNEFAKWKNVLVEGVLPSIV